MVWNGRGGGIRTPDPLLPKQMRYQTALRPDASFDCNAIRKPCTGSDALIGPAGLISSESRLSIERNATIKKGYGGYSSAAERLTVAQDVVGSIPTSRPMIHPSIQSLRALILRISTSVGSAAQSSRF